MEWRSLREWIGAVERLWKEFQRIGLLGSGCERG